MGSKALMVEGTIRMLAVVLSSMAAVLLALDSQSKTVFLAHMKATVKEYLPALWNLTIVASIAAGYQLLQACRCLACAWLSTNPCGCNRLLAWMCFLLDQATTYATFTASAAGTQIAAVALFGVSHLQWSKLCYIFTRFCVIGASGVVCGFLASIAMAVVSSISARHLFRLYPSPERHCSGHGVRR